MSLVGRHTILVGVLLILGGFLLRVFFIHSYEYWTALDLISFLTIILGLISLYASVKSYFFKKYRRVFNRNIKMITNLVLVTITAMLVWICIPYSRELNYNLWSSNLDKNGYVVDGWYLGEIKLGGHRYGNEKFYLVSFERDGKLVNSGVYAQHQDREGNLALKMIEIKESFLKIKGDKYSKVKIQCSKKYPSMIKILSFY